MTRSSERHHRRSIRLKGYDYTQPGAYFVTICTYDREGLFGHVVDGHMVLNACGEMVRACWREIPDHFPHVALDAFVVMPNHVHGILWIVGDVGARHAVPLHNAETIPKPHAVPLHNAETTPNPHAVTLHNAETIPNQKQFGKPVPGSIPTIIGAFKSAVTRRINALRGTPGTQVWQRNYWEHIIRTERTLNAVRRYIAENPLRWHLDRENPDAVGTDPVDHDLWRMLQNDAHTEGNQ
jgi:REP element-mobilizing transposase RayT